MAKNKPLTEIQERKLIDWFKTKYNQGDDYYATLDKDGLYVVGYFNDYPLQHGKGKSYKLTNEEFDKIVVA